VKEQEWKLRDEAEEEEENEKRILVRVLLHTLERERRSLQARKERERECYVDHLVIRDEDGSAADRISVISILLEVLHSAAGSWRIVALHAGSCFLALHLCCSSRISWRILSSESLSSLPL
jgi:hypothetical protein